MKRLVEGLHFLFTGILPEEIPDDQFGAPGIGALAGCRVVCGLDRIQQTVPAEYFPIVIIEPGEAPLTRKGHFMAGPASIRVDIVVRVPGRLGALFGRSESQPGILEISESVNDAICANETLGGAAVCLQGAGVKHRGIFERSSPWMGKRVAILDLSYTIHRIRGGQ